MPNIRLRLHLKDSLDKSMCIELQKMFNLEQDLTDTKVEIGNKYYRYRWEIRVKNPKKFKRKLAAYQENNPDTDIFSEELSWFKSIVQYIGYIVGFIFLISRIFW